MSQTNKPTVNSFFCGAGGLDLGLIEAGFQVVSAWDFDKFAVQSYQANIGNHVRQADIRQMLAEDLPKADLWAFGFPCQDLSVAGKQAGLFEGKRSGLFFEVMRLLDETEEGKKPRILLAENVKGLKPYLPVLQEEYAKRGYVMHVGLFNSKYFGVPQSRERYFVVGIREGVFQFPEQQTFFVPKLSSILEEKVDEKYYISDEKAAKIIEQAMKRVELNGTHACITPDRTEKRQNGRRAKEEEEPMFTLTAQDIHGVICKESGLLNPEGCSRTLRVGGKGFISHKHNYEHVLVPDTRCIAEMYPGSHAGRVWDTEGLSPTIKTPSEGNTQPLIVVEEAPRYRVRKLTPTEFGRLQGFPMDRWEQVVSDSQAYKQFGNAVTVLVAKAIGQAILEQLF